MANTKAVAVDENDRARALVREMITKYFEGDQQRAARAMEISQPTLSEFLSKKKGLGGRVIRGIALVDPMVVLRIFRPDFAADLSTEELQKLLRMAAEFIEKASAVAQAPRQRRPRVEYDSLPPGRTESDLRARALKSRR